MNDLYNRHPGFGGLRTQSDLHQLLPDLKEWSKAQHPEAGYTTTGMRPGGVICTPQPAWLGRVTQCLVSQSSAPARSHFPCLARPRIIPNKTYATP